MLQPPPLKTKEIGLTALQMNGIAVNVVENSVHVLLANGNTACLKCSDKQKAHDVKNTILYYPVNKENAGHDFKEDIEVTIMSFK